MKTKFQLTLQLHLDLDENLEPSDTVVGKFNDMQERGVLTYVEWVDVGRKDLEAQGKKKEEYFKKDLSGFMKQYSRTLDVPVDVSTDRMIKNPRALDIQFL